MLRTNLQILLVVLATLGLYTWMASTIPQVESAVPEELTFTGDVSAEDLVAAGEELYDGAGACTSCHGLGTRAPNLLTGHDGEGPIGARCGERVAGMDCKAYLYASMVDPAAYLVEGFGPIMPDQSRTLSEAQIWALVAFLQAQGGEVTVTGADIGEDGAGAAGAPAGAAAAGGAAAGSAPATGSTDPMEILRANACLGCHELDGQGAALGPPFDGIGARRDAEYIRRSILDPGADVPEGYEAMAGVMPPTFGQSMTAAQLEAVVRFLVEQR